MFTAMRQILIQNHTVLSAQNEVPRVDDEKLSSDRLGESSEMIRKRVRNRFAEEDLYGK